MTPKEQEFIDILQDRIYVMVTLEEREVSYARTEYEKVTIKIKNISKRMTKDEIMSKYTMFDWMHYPAHYKSPRTPINFWQGGGIIYCSYIPVTRFINCCRILKSC